MSESALLRRNALVKLAGAIVVAGLLVAAMLLPFVGGTGLVARNSSTLLDALPVELTDKTPSGNTKVLAADGSEITEFFTNNRTPVTPDQISDVMKQAIVDIEDSRFYEHNGLDVQGTLRALAKNVAAGGVEEGGSTLTQQLVKQTLLQTASTPEEQQAATAQTVGRKLKEARLALALEQTYSKDEILTRYLNIAYFGEGSYGIQAAAQKYFSVNAIDLTLPQASVLAGLVQSPTNDDPIVNPDAGQKRRNQVLQRMHDLGHITDQELADVSAAPIPLAEGGTPPNGCIDATVGGFFCDYMYNYLTGTLGISADAIKTGGWTIQTTLRPDIQTSGDQAVLNTLPMGGGNDLAGVFTAVEPGTGHVLAMSVNRRYGCDAYECESVNLNTATSAGAGSTYKVFTAAAALSQGYGSHYTLTTPQPYSSKVFKKNGGTTGAPYVVSNVGNNYPDTMDMTAALVESSNTYFVGLEDALGSVEPVVRTAQAMGLHSIDATADQIIAEKRGSFTLGVDATSPLYLASAYSTLAGNGTQCEPTPVISIVDSTGEPVTKDDGTPYVSGNTCKENAIPAGVATTLNQMMIGDTVTGTATRAAIPGHQIAGKTGTIQDNKSATFVGSTPKYTVSVMVFNPKSQQDVGGYGGNKPATIYHDAMLPILSKEPSVPFPPADPLVVSGNRPTVPSCSSVSSCQDTLTQAGFRPVVSQVTSSRSTGSFLGTSPRAGAQASVGQVVTIQVSNGSGYRTPSPTTRPQQRTTPAPDSSTPTPEAPAEDSQPAEQQPGAPEFTLPDWNGDGDPGA
ncbi:penicillin-binding protein [Modestobacter altitudinis]|uniref:penicillin-binding protein n=1 Tax=Modestobacter altitudinis TaxID=2213158 RepID=UPI00110CF19E|nr:transglycosylase domain-containing protein [Modestobacter altitudinis]